MVLSFDNVSFGYRSSDPVLREVHLDLPGGSFIALTGPSGSGKSTLLLLAVGELKAQVGLVTFDRGGTGSPRPVEPTDRRSMGIVSQEAALLERLTIRENAKLCLAIGGADEDEGLARFDALADALEIAEDVDRVPGELSGGQRARASLTCALARNPRVLIADEPTGTLDRDSTHVVVRILAQVRKLMPELAMLVATHDPVVAGAADEVRHLTNGRLTCGG